MKQSVKKCGVASSVLACALLIAGTAAAQDASQTEAAPVAGERPALGTLDSQAGSAAARAVPAPDGTAQGNVAQLIQLIHAGQLNELRTTYNGTYGASLFLSAREVTYYVALFQDRHFWRVIQTGDRARAEAIYAAFVQQTVQLSDIEIRMTELQAQNAFLDRIIALQNDQAKRLQADIAIARSQQEQVAEQQRQARGEAAALQAEKNQAQEKLRELMREVEQLQRQNDADLPGSR
jgi:chromosome segregation ATPase